MEQETNEGTVIKNLESFDFQKPIQIQTFIDDDDDDPFDTDLLKSNLSNDKPIHTDGHINKKDDANNSIYIATNHFEYDIKEEFIEIHDDFSEVVKKLAEAQEKSKMFIASDIDNLVRKESLKRKNTYEDPNNSKVSKKDQTVEKSLEVLDGCMNKFINTVSKHILYVAAMIEFQNRSLQSDTKTLEKVKGYFYGLSYSTVVNLFLPQESNKYFKNYFLNTTMKLAQENKLNTSYKTIEKIYLEMLFWSKRKQKFISMIPMNQQKATNITSPRQNLERISAGNAITTDPAQNRTIFSAGPPGQEITINIDTNIHSKIITQNNITIANGNSVMTQNNASINGQLNCQSIAQQQYEASQINKAQMRNNGSQNTPSTHNKSSVEPINNQRHPAPNMSRNSTQLSKIPQRNHIPQGIQQPINSQQAYLSSNQICRREYPPPYNYSEKGMQNFQYSSQNLKYNTQPPPRHEAAMVSKNYPTVNQMLGHMPQETNTIEFSNQYDSRYQIPAYMNQGYYSIPGNYSQVPLQRQVTPPTPLRAPPPYPNYHYQQSNNQWQYNRSLQTNENTRSDQNLNMSVDKERMRSASIDSGFASPSPINFDNYVSETIKLGQSSNFNQRIENKIPVITKSSIVNMSCYTHNQYKC